jgi:hypothetical protein
VRERFAREVKKLSSAYNAALWVMEKEFKKVNRTVSERIHKLRREVEKEFPSSPASPRHRLGRSCCGRHAAKNDGWPRAHLRATHDLSSADGIGFVGQAHFQVGLSSFPDGCFHFRSHRLIG